MAADKQIMKQIETLRLDRPGRMYQVLARLRRIDPPTTGDLAGALAELAATYREEAELWAKSGAKGWKGSEAENYLIAQAIDSVAAQLDNAGGGAALSVSEPERKTAHQWNADPRVDPVVESWSDFGMSANMQGINCTEDTLITLAEFEQIRDGGAVTVSRRAPATTHERLDDLVNSAVAEGRGMPKPLAQMDVAEDGPDVESYLKGDVNTLPGLREALVPGSVTSAPETDNPFASAEDVADAVAWPGDPTVAADGYVAGAVEITATDAPPARWCIACTDDGDRKLAAPGKAICDDCASLPDDILADAIKLNQDHPMPKTWESEIMSANGHLLPGMAKTLSAAPPLGQPGDNSGGGYSHDYIPPSGRRLTFADLLQPVPAASLPPHLSHSQGTTIGDCAAKYRMQRVELLPQIPQWANIGGTAFHAAVEAFERTVAGLGVISDHARANSWEGYDCELVWKHHFDATIAAVAATTTVPQSVWRSSRKGAEGEAWWWVNGPKFLRAYLDARPDELTMPLPLAPGIEYDVTVDVPSPYGPLPFNAKIDRVTTGHVSGRPEIGALIIRDYKTSYERPTDTTQLGDYAQTLRLHFAQLGGGPITDVPIYGSYFDARRGTWTEPVDLLATHPFEAFQYRVTTAHAQKRALTTGPTPARPSSFCGGCSVRYACPVMALKS